MRKVPTAKQIGTRIKKRRETKGLSQLELAEKMSVSRTSIVQLELGNRNLAAIELFKLAEILDCTMDELMLPYSIPKQYTILTEPDLAYKTSKRQSTPSLDAEKLESIFLYIIQVCASYSNAEESNLNKLLYFCDFNYYERYEEHLSGLQYKKLSSGPIPSDLPKLTMRLIQEKKIQRLKLAVNNKKQIRLFSMRGPDLTQFNAAEKSTIDHVIAQMGNWTAEQFKQYISNDMPWKATEEGDWIHYNLAFYREAPYSAL